jgi:hypothetical protein
MSEERNCEGCKNYKLLESNSSDNGKLTEIYSCKLWDCKFEPKETEADLIKKRLFELIWEIDGFSAGNKDATDLRVLHYQNCDWLGKVGLQEEYYNYMLGRMEGDNEDNE